MRRKSKKNLTNIELILVKHTLNMVINNYPEKPVILSIK